MKVSIPSHQHARSNGPTAAADCFVSVTRARRVDIAVAPVEGKTAFFFLGLVFLAG